MCSDNTLPFVQLGGKVRREKELKKTELEYSSMPGGKRAETVTGPCWILSLNFN